MGNKNSHFKQCLETSGAVVIDDKRVYHTFFSLRRSVSLAWIDGFPSETVLCSSGCGDEGRDGQYYRQLFCSL